MASKTESTASKRLGVSRLAFVVVLIGVILVTATVLSQRADDPTDDGRGTPYIVKRADNICGISIPRHIAHPAKLNYDRVFQATPQARKMKRDRIDPESARGIILHNQGAALVRTKCVEIQQQKRYCSIWKRIRRRDGKPLPDITKLVLAALERVTAETVEASAPSSSAGTSAAGANVGATDDT